VPGIAHLPETGYHLSAYVGHADEELRSSGASGGVATWLLERLLEEGIVDHTICVIPNDDHEKLFSFKVFDSPEEVRKGSGSAYYPVEMSEVIRHILETPGRYAIIGLPCFIKAIRLAQMRNKKLNERVTVTLGLVCGQLKNRFFTDYIAALADVHGRVKSVQYRRKSTDRPASNFYFAFKDERGEERRVLWDDGISEAWNNRWFTPKACNYCDDVFAECADATCMDAWLPEYSKDGRGTSIILIRSPVIAQMIETGICSHKISLAPIPISQVVKSQEGVVKIKREHLAYRLYLDRQSGCKAPEKRVAPARPKNPFLRREIILKERMRTLSRGLWDPEGPDLGRFTKGMKPYLKQKKNGELVFNVFILPFMIISQKIRRFRHE
jgi:coenzyme F420-reducing hydrogenase beta subunit